MKVFTQSWSSTPLLSLFLLLTSGCLDTGRDCAVPSCAPPNINWLVGIEILFESQDAADLQELLLIRYDRGQSSPLDTITLDVSASRQLIIGQGSEIGFTSDVFRDRTVEEVELDYEILVDNDTYEVGEIEITSAPEPCGCRLYTIASLEFNGERIYVNDTWARFTL
ncbi:MAG: hypothetical protein AAGA85_13475 [Bacteroidota bacterium]